MDTNQATPPPPEAPARIDWVDVVGTAFLAGTLHVLGQLVKAEMTREREAAERAAEAARVVASARAEEAAREEAEAEPIDDAETAVGDADDEAEDAARLLGVSIDASEDEIRAALRAHLASSRLHPDQGGDGEEAKRLIAAKNLLAERARRMVRP